MTRIAISTFVLLAVTACWRSGTEPLTPHDVAGDYVATRLVTTTAGVSTDQLAAGAAITLTLRTNGTTSGTIFAPGGGEDGGDFEADLEGTWTLRGDTVQLAHEADTFLRDMPLIASGKELRGDETFGDTRVELALRK
jgi:hypothetical protein